MFTSPKVLHLTLLMLSLKDQKAVDRAIGVMKSLEKDIHNKVNENGGLFLKFSKIQTFGNKDAAKVVYAEPSNVAVLKQITHLIIKAFIDTKLAPKLPEKVIYNRDTKQYEQKQLHLTLMSSS